MLSKSIEMLAIRVSKRFSQCTSARGTIGAAMSLGPPPVRRLRVGFVLTELVGGGAERSMLSIIDALDRARFDPALVVFGARQDHEPPAETLIHVLSQRGGFAPGRLVSRALELASLFTGDLKRGGVAPARALYQVAELLAAGAVPGRWSPFAATLPGGEPGAIPAVREGRAGVQDEGSQLVALALAATPIEGSDRRWLDQCAGPGGKAALLGMAMSALDDMRFAGLIMKVLVGFSLWITITVVFFRWYNAEETGPPARRVSRDLDRELMELQQQ